jgi:hypothetical protein
MIFKKLVAKEPKFVFYLSGITIEPLPNVVEDNVVYFFTCYDIRHYYNITDTISDMYWEHLSRDKTSIFVYDNSHEPTDIPALVIELKKLLHKFNIEKHQIYVILPDDLHLSAFNESLEEHGMNGINAESHPIWSLKVNLRDGPKSDFQLKQFLSKKSKHKFSVLSRSFKLERLQFFIQLVNENLIDDFLYTFHNIIPYGDVTVYPISDLKKQIPDNYDKNKIEKWMDRIPYTIDDEEFPGDIMQDKFIIMSHIHIVIETIFTQGFNDLKIPWLTEKTYKAIGCKRPFIVYSTPGTLQAIKALGYKTFHPYIDETYDTIMDPTLRRNAIIAEIKRLSALPNDEFTEIINKCKNLTEHNYKILENEQKKQRLTSLKKLGLLSKY